jgi:hypothetical protein
LAAPGSFTGASMIERHPITDREAWLRLRHRDVTASVAAALLDAHERVTRLGLWLDKRGDTPPPPLEDTPPLRRGRLMEPVAIEVIREMRPDWKVEAPGIYVRDTERRIGCTPDTIVEDEHGRLGVVEIKSVEPGIFERSWRDVDGSISPPIAAAIQAIACKHLCEAEWCAVAPLRISHGVELDIVMVEEPPALWARLCEAAAEFWRSIEEGVPPEPTFPADTETVLRLHRESDPGFTVDLSGHNRIVEMRDRDAELAEREKSACEERRALKAELVHLLGPAEVGLFNGRPIVTAKSVTRKAYSVPESTYRDVRFKRSAP